MIVHDLAPTDLRTQIAPRHHNGQVRTTLYVRVHALPALRRRFAIKAVTA